MFGDELEKVMVHISGIYVKWLSKHDTVQMTVKYLIFNVNFILCTGLNIEVINMDSTDG